MLLVLIEGNWKVSAWVASMVCKFHTKFCKNGHFIQKLERKVNVHRQNQDWMT